MDLDVDYDIYYMNLVKAKVENLENPPINVVGSMLEKNDNLVYKKSFDWIIPLDTLMQDGKAEIFYSPMLHLGPKRHLRFQMAINKHENDFLFFSLKWAFLLDWRKNKISHDIALIFSEKNKVDKFSYLKKLDNFKCQCNMYPEKKRQIFYTNLNELNIIVKKMKFKVKEVNLIVRLNMTMTTSETSHHFYTKSYKDLFLNQEITDVELTVKNNNVVMGAFGAHVTVLSARSEVFRAMLNGNFLEKMSRKIYFEETTISALRNFLYYLYTDTIDDPVDFNNHVFEIFKLADKYFVKSLKDICERILIDSMTIDSVIDLFVLAERYDARLLKKESIEMIRYFIRRSHKTFKQKCKIILNENLFKEITKFSSEMSGVEQAKNVLDVIVLN